MDEKTKQLLLSLLDKFVAVSEQYHLQYYLSGGSVIGAVRHKGFIPWDDDIDVHMPRADYEKLQKLPASVWGENMRLASWRTVPGYPYDFLKLELTNTTVIERLPTNYVGGIYLDVFPLDFISENEKKNRSFEKQYVKLERRYIKCTTKNDRDCQSIWELLDLKISRLLYNHRAWMEKWEKEAMSLGGNNDNICFSHDYFYFHGSMSPQWFGKGKPMEFEGKKYLVPADYDAYLTHVFGDYMTLPPVECRHGHPFLFVNPDRRISPSEQKTILKQLHEQYAYHFSIKRELKYILRKMGLMK